MPLRAGRSEVRIPVGEEGFSSPKRPYRLYGGTATYSTGKAVGE